MEQYDQFKENARPLAEGLFGRRPGLGRRMGIDFKEGAAVLEFEGRTFGTIQARFKGNSSFNYARNALKRSFKLDFNDGEKGRTFFGLTKLNLNNNAMDASQLREALAYHVFRLAGVPASRTAFAKVFVTVPGKYERHYAGLYTVVEQVDERFLKDRFGTKSGLLLKPERIPGLPYLGEEWTAYTNRVSPKTKGTPDEEGIRNILREYPVVAVVEEHSPVGSLGAKVKAVAWDMQARCQIRTFSLKDEFIHVYGSHAELLAAHGLSVDAICQTMSPLLRQNG
jgi:hypothetical protein